MLWVGGVRAGGGVAQVVGRPALARRGVKHGDQRYNDRLDGECGRPVVGIHASVDIITSTCKALRREKDEKDEKWKLTCMVKKKKMVIIIMKISEV